MTHINQRRDSAAAWTAADPILQLGEVGWETNTRKAKLGDGVTAWTALPYVIEGEVISVNGYQGVVVLDQDDVGLNAVDNVPDANKPVSSPQQAALNLKAPLASPVFTGNPTGPTPAVGDDDTSLATTAFVRGELDDITAPHMVVFTADGSFSKGSYPSLRGVRARVLAAGGAGGGAAATAAGESSAGAGGASGGYSEVFVAESALAASETIVVGTGGVGVSAGTGGTGEDSSFGSFALANGGPGGAVMASNSNVNVNPDSAQAVAGTGDIAAPGSVGMGVIRAGGTQIRSGTGGDSRLAGGARSVGDASSNGVDGSYGAGGSGAVSLDGAGARTGGDGGNGRVIVELFY